MDAFSEKRQKISLSAKPTGFDTLRSRWELSSKTGTPLHPDATEDELLEVAKQISNTKVSERRSIVSKFTSMPHIAMDTSSYKNYASIYKPNNERSYSAYYHSRSYYGYSYEEALENENGYGDVFEEEVSHLPSSNGSRGMLNGMDFDDKVFDCINAPKHQSKSFLEENNRPSASTLSLAPSTLPDPDEVNVTMEGPVSEEFTPESPQTTSDSIHSNIETLSISENDPALAHSLSFYRKQRQGKEKKKAEVIVIKSPPTPPKKIEPEPEVVELQVERNKQMERVMAQLRQAIAVEDQHIHQASRALVYCRQSGQFCGSRQEVEGQRALLVATETRNVLVGELERINRQEPDASVLPRGMLQFSRFRLFLSKNFLKGYVNHYDDLNITYYFIILLKCGSTLLHTALLSTEDGIQADGAIEYNQYLKIENICSDFDCLLEVYALRSSKRYEQKRKKSGSMKSLNAAFSFSTKSPKTPKKTPSGNRILDSKFHLVGNLYLNMENVDNGEFHLNEPQHPLEGTLQITVKKYSI